MDKTPLQVINEQKAATLLAERKHEELLNANVQVSNTVIATTESLIKYLEGHVTKTQVVNQLKHIGTPDALKVIPEIQALHDTLKTHTNTDLTEVTKVMQGILDEAKKIPKELPKEQEQKFVDYTKQFTSLGEAVKAVEKVIKAQKLVAEAPIVNVPETNVHVDAPDLKPLQTNIEAVVKAIKDIVIPEYKTDNAGVEKLIKESNKLLKDLLKKPVSSGGGGGGSSWVAINTAGTPMPIQLDSSGNVPVAFSSPVSSTPSTTSVSDAATSTSLLASNTSRKGATITNDSSAALYVLLGSGSASTTNYSVRLVQYAYYEVPFGYTGAIKGIWASDPNDGGARMTELT